MKIKTLVGISLVIFVILIVNVFAFGLLSKNNSTSTASLTPVTIVNKTDENLVQNQLNNANIVQPSNSNTQGNSNTASSSSQSSSNQNQGQNSIQSQPAQTVQQTAPTRRVTRAS